jgi:hypothetical protein
MNLRHAAALALVGWYLMVPSKKDPNAPIRDWGHYGSYDTAKECGEEQEWLYQRSKLANSKISENQAAGSECIASDDPRLKGN